MVQGEKIAMKRSGGFTIVELMIVITVAAIGIGLAIPSFRGLIERKQLGGATEAAFQHLQRAKTQAVKRSKPIVVDFYVNGTDWAIGFTDKVADGCDAEDTSGTNLCTVDENNDIGVAGANDLVMRVVGSDYRNVTMSQATAFADPAVFPGACVTTNTHQACFDFLRGLARTGQYEFDSANYKLRVEVTMMGNIKVCLPSGEKKIAGYQDC
jgi:type IV fimbrial biogenesis protein FimT